MNLHHQTLDLSPADAGRLARRSGLLRWPPYGAANLDACRKWCEGYDAEQARVEAAAQWARDHAATVDEWGFV